MPSMDSTAKAALAADHAIAWFIWADIVGDPIRITTHAADIVPASTGDADLDGHTFASFDHRAIQVGDVGNSDSGSDTLTIDLSGIASIDSALMAEINDKTNWQTRTVRLWFRMYDPTGTTPQGAYVPYYTGYASQLRVLLSPETQTIRLEVENYQAAFNEPSNRSYLNQKDYDPDDNSAEATLAAANMGRGTPGPGGASGGSGGSGGGGGLGGVLGGILGMTALQ